MSGKTIKLLALQSPQIVIDTLATEFEARSGHRLVQLLAREDLPVHASRKLDEDIAWDAAFVVPAILDSLEAQNRLIDGSRAGFLRVPIGVAVRAGARKPDIGSVDAFRQAVLNAGSIAYLRAGTSGPYLENLFDRLGIGAELKPKTTRTETDTVGELVAAGEIEMGITAIATMMATPGVDIVGKLPAEIISTVDFEAAVNRGAAEPDAAAELVRFVTGPDAHAVIASKGMEPWD